MVFLYNDTIHNFGEATDTGVANVTIFMDVFVNLQEFGGGGVAREYTGIDIGGGGGTGDEEGDGGDDDIDDVNANGIFALIGLL